MANSTKKQFVKTPLLNRRLVYKNVEFELTNIQRLNQGKLLTLTETREINGITEKYYKAKSTRFLTSSNEEFTTNKDNISSRILTQLLLTSEDREKLVSELVKVLEKWESLPKPKNEEELLEVRPVD
ncbi:hypothetical protein [Paenibacillus tianmuensis]|uniref:hypothetical protein n=1 Tax=Paenibacillus tianmuensis TaxID=624147 RepID=UPI001FE1170E|nr:hypothetical protein [Paenibacillus tianmuensis]